MKLPSVIHDLRHRTGMFISPVTLDGVMAFINGYDLASSGGFLVGFREWLIQRLGHGDNLAWNGLILEMFQRKTNSDADEAAIEALFQLLEEFVEARQAHDGLRRIFVEYEQWLHRQDWYTPQNPRWIGPSAPARSKPRGKQRDRHLDGQRKRR